MPVIQAREKHFMDIMFLIRACVADMNSRKMFNWNNSYPSSEMILDDIRIGSLYIFMENGICQGIIVLNDSRSEEYRGMDWKTEDGRVLIVHRLAVNPLFQGKGTGRKLMEFAVEHARNSDYSAIWLDVIESNLQANDLYAGMGFRQTGSFHFPYQRDPFICYELLL
jgi:ribosomal protein S18 acetylase RimI-like enzyme